MLLNNTSFQAVWVRPFWGKVVWLMSESLLGNGQQGHLRGCKREPIWNLNENFKDLHEGSCMRSSRLVWNWVGFNLRRLIPTWGSSQPWCSRADLSSSQLQGTPRCRAGKSSFLRLSSQQKVAGVQAVEGGGGRPAVVQAARQEDLLQEGQHWLHQECLPETAQGCQKREV